MAGGGDAGRTTGVWWDLNTCPVPAGVDPRRVRACIESAWHKETGYPARLVIHAIGNLEYISSALLEDISSSGITVTHAPRGGNDLRSLLWAWAKLAPPPATVMLISNDVSMVNPNVFEITGYTAFCAYVRRPVTLDDPLAPKFFLKEFVWQTLLEAHYSTAVIKFDDKPLCICDICDEAFQTCAEFITHLKSEEHTNELFQMVPVDGPDSEPIYLCRLCNYPAYDEFNMVIHDESDEHLRKLSESKKREPLADLVNQREEEEEGQVFTK